MAKQRWVEFHYSDFLADIVAWGLTLEQVGAYTRLLSATWKRKAPIPDDERTVAQILGCTKHRWRTKIRPALIQFFDVSDGLLVQKRAEEVLETAKIHIENRGRKSKNSAKNSPENGADLNAETAQKTTPTHAGARDNHNHRDESPDGDSSGDRRGTRLPSDFAVPPDWVADGYAARTRDKLPEVDLDAEARRFVRHFAAKTGREGTKRDWRLTWLNWCTSPYCGGRNGSGTHANGHGRDAPSLAAVGAQIEAELAARDVH